MNLFTTLKSCWLAALVGSILLTAGTCVLFWNEARAVSVALSLNEALSVVVSVDANSPFSEKHIGQLIHIKGFITTDEPLTAPDYGIQIQAVKLRQRVQMYQWIEEYTESNFGQPDSSFKADDRTYYYSTVWRDELIDSRSFHIRSGHHNPMVFPMITETYVADQVKIGNYELGNALKSKFDDFEAFNSGRRPDDPFIKLHSGIYYHCDDVWNPEIGDIRVQFYYAGLQGSHYTVVGKFDGKKIIPFEAPNTRKILLMYPGKLGKDDIFQLEHQAKRNITWRWRLVGWILLFFSTTCSASVLEHIAAQSAMIRKFLPNPKFSVSAKAVTSFSFALVVISLAWIQHRPLLASGICFSAVLLFLYCVRRFFINFFGCDCNYLASTESHHYNYKSG